LDTWLHHAVGVEPDAYHAAVGRNIIGGVVRRVRQPGCKHDTMAVFTSPEGLGKSTLGEVLATKKDWFTDDIVLGEESKELVLKLAGKMICEIPEMVKKHSDTEKIKAMLSRTHDLGRPAYARSPVNRPRRNIFLGSSNLEKPLIDPTGNRRYLPVVVEKEIDLNWVKNNLPQLIAEACVLETAGETFQVPREVWEDAKERQEAARAPSGVEEWLQNWLGKNPGDANYMADTYVTSADLMELAALCGWSVENRTRREALMKLGFRDTRIGNPQVRVWLRGDAKKVTQIYTLFPKAPREPRQPGLRVVPASALPVATAFQGQ
jgi:predicted P-loop ATPase